MKLSDYIFKFLNEKGLKHIFLLPGGGAMHLVDSVGRSNIEYICCLHEQGAAIAAEAYAQYTNNLGCALVTTGPGGTNAITGVTSCWIDSIPCIFISGQVKTQDLMKNYGVRQFGFQEINITDIVKPITKYAVTITNPEQIKLHLEKALFLAKNGRPGPVWIDIPLDVQASEIDVEKLESYNSEKNYKIPEDFNIKIKKIINLINKSERPVIIVGNGVRLSNGINEFYKVIEKLKIPIQTTWKTIDIIEDDHYLFAGRPGIVSSRWANFVIQCADLLICIGTRLDLGITAYNHENFAKNAKKVIIDIDENEIKKLNMPIEVELVCDAKLFIEGMLENINLIKKKSRKEWFNKIKVWKEKYPVVEQNYYKEKNFVNDYVLIDVLSDLLGEGDNLVPGSSGACSERTMQAFRVKKGLRIINSPGLGAMGFGVPASIGVCIASGRKRTVCINGDGGFFLNIQELEVVKRLNLPIKFFILDNNGYASIRATQKRFFGRLTASSCDAGMTLPSIEKIAEGFGIKSVTIDNQKNIKERIKKILEYNGPLICRVICNPDQETKPRVSSKALPDGKIVSMPMENMYPFLHDEIIKKELKNCEN